MDRRLPKVILWMVSFSILGFITAAAPPSHPISHCKALYSPGSFAGCEPQTPSESRSQPDAFSARVTPRLLQELAANGEADVLVFVKGRPDLRPARALPGKAARGKFVFNALYTTAERTQAGLRHWLNAQKVPFQSFWIVNMLRVRATPQLVEALAAHPAVLKLDTDRIALGLKSDPVLVPQPAVMQVGEMPWGIERIGAPAVWARGIRGQGIVVAGNDTGVDWDHEALKATYRGWDGEAVNHHYQWHDAWAKTPLEPSDDNGHGTHTLGIVAGSGPRKVGVAPDAQWIACRNMDSGVGTPSSYVDCFQFFLAPTDLNGENPRPDLAPHIINNSWSCIPAEGCHPDDPLWEDTIQPAVEALNEAGIAVVVSAGNSGPACATIQDPPAIYPQAINVGATDPADLLTAFSSRGPLVYAGVEWIAPDLVAPGLAVESSMPGDQYAFLSGTSMAAPHVAGAIALLWSAFPQLIGHLPVTEQVLRATATPMQGQECGGAEDGQPNNLYGWGLIDVDAAVQKAGDLVQLQGTVTDRTGQPLPAVDVKLVDPTWGVEIQLFTGEDGSFMTPVLPGTYQVAIDSPAYFEYAGSVQVPADAVTPLTVALTACVDWNEDGRTGLFEIQTLANIWQEMTYRAEYDIDQNAEINIVDVALLTAHFDEPCMHSTPGR